MKPKGKRALDRILDDSYVADLAAVPMADLRARREEVEREEAWLSYIRRMLHGRIDILDNSGVIGSDGELDLDALVASLSGQMGAGSHLASLECRGFSRGRAACGRTAHRPDRVGRSRRTH